MSDLLKLFSLREIDDWREDFTLMAAATLNELATDLIVICEGELKEATWNDGFLGQSAFVSNRIIPLVQGAVGPVVEQIFSEANEALERLVQHQAAWRHDSVVGVDERYSTGAWQDVAVAAVPLAAGVTVAAALPTFAVTSSTAFFGLVTTTAISWPVALGGGAVAALAIGTGVLNTGRIWNKAEARLRTMVRNHVIATLLKGSADQPSILEQVSSALETAAQRAKEIG